ncbi:MAG TPA: hypothetical protein VNU26_06370 [Mycobacteriales bacterium]|nr:hypothetical protein [Mycobacteriales bacterium]
MTTTAVPSSTPDTTVPQTRLGRLCARLGRLCALLRTSHEARIPF